MVSLFGLNRPKTAADLCRSAKVALVKVLSEGKASQQADEEIGRYLEEMRGILEGTQGMLPVTA